MNKEQKAAHGWAVMGLHFRDRTFQYRNRALDFAAEEFAKDVKEPVMIQEDGGFHSIAMLADEEGAVHLFGDYTDDVKRYLTHRIDEEIGLRKVKAAA